MKKIIALSAIAGSAVLLASCATNQPMGTLYTGATLPVNATSNAGGAKTGQACATSILGLVATGDASVAAAKADGHISNVTSIDWSVSNILGVYGEYCTIVKGN